MLRSDRVRLYCTTRRSPASICGRSPRLTDKTGCTTLTGLFLVRVHDKARSLRDLGGRKVLFGPAWKVEKRDAAVAALSAAGVKVREPLPSRPGCDGAGSGSCRWNGGRGRDLQLRGTVARRLRGGFARARCACSAVRRRRHSYASSYAPICRRPTSPRCAARSTACGTMRRCSR